jgi:hypothetical protein
MPYQRTVTTTQNNRDYCNINTIRWIFTSNLHVIVVLQEKRNSAMEKGAWGESKSHTTAGEWARLLSAMTLHSERAQQHSGAWTRAGDRRAERRSGKDAKTKHSNKFAQG